MEIPLRVRDEGLTLAVEEDYATFRNLIDAEAPLDQVEDVSLEVRRGLDEVERTLSEPGLAAPIIAMSYAFTILFREGLEAVLVVAAILGYLEASRNNQYRGPILKGVAAAGVATVITFILATAVIQLAPLQRELIEAATASARRRDALLRFVLVDHASGAPALDGVRQSQGMDGSDDGVGYRSDRCWVHRGLSRGVRDRALLPGTPVVREGLTGYVVAGVALAARQLSARLGG